MPEVPRRTCGEAVNMNIVKFLCRRGVEGDTNSPRTFTRRLFDSAKDLYKKNLVAHFGCVNAIEFSSDGNLLFSGGDDRRVLMWNVNDAMMYYTGKLGDGAKPFEMKRCHYSNIFCLAVDDDNKRVLSGSHDDQVIVHDYTTGNLVDVFLHDSPVFSLSLHPNNGNIFASAAENGRILIYDIRESNADLLCVAKLRTPFHGVTFNPCEPSLIATANSKVGVHIWDLRKPKEILLKCSDDASMAVRWNQTGTILLALRNLLPIVIYDPLSPKRKLEFDAGTYFNACTMKSCSFAGDNDEYILSGSDDFNLYMWKIPQPWPESRWIGYEHLTLTGHRSIVNQVRYSPCKQLIATSGVEKIVKLWSPFPMPYSEGSHDKPTNIRHRVLCSSRTCTRSPGFLSHDYSQESVEEDTGMIHFFDSLLRDELRNELDEANLLPLSQTYHLDTNSLSNKKRETRFYERLIRRKKKRLSKILLEKSDDGKAICSLTRNKEQQPSPTEKPTDTEGESDVEQQLTSSSSQSKVSVKLIFLDSKSIRNKLNDLKDSGINLSESSDSDEVRPCALFKRKRVASSRCYRNSSKKKRTESDSSDSTNSRDSETEEKESPANSQGTSSSFRENVKSNEESSANEKTTEEEVEETDTLCESNK